PCPPVFWRPRATGAVLSPFLDSSQKVVALRCRYCGESIAQERVDEGYDYCVKRECCEQGLRALNVVAIHVNKSNDQFALREQLDIPEIAGGAHIDGGQYGIPHRSARREPEVLT